jgi:hypothetical protein
VSANWAVVVILVVVVVPIFACCCYFVADVVVLALSCFNGRMSASFCHMSNLIANLVNEEPAAARRLNKNLAENCSGVLPMSVLH